MENEKLLKKVFVSNFCNSYNCGSQRCDGSEEWVDGCAKYQELKTCVCKKLDELKED